MVRLLIFFLTTVSAFPASWYVDSSAAGSASGTSWANAWTHPTNINWTGVSAGDTIYISGGSVSKTYVGSISFGKSGTAGSRITITVSDDAGHNGHVIMDGENVDGRGGALNFGSYDHVTVDGRGSAAFASPTNNFHLDSGSSALSNNIRLWFVNNRASAGNSGAAVYFASTSPNDITLRWIGVTNVTRNTASTGSGASGQAAYGIWINQTSGGSLSNIVVEYCLFDHVEDDGIQCVGNDAATRYDHVTIRFSIFSYVGDDGMEVNHGWSIHDNIIGPSRAWHGHPDGIQSNGSWFKIYNNRFYNFLNAFMRLQSSSATNWVNILAYNNLMLGGTQGHIGEVANMDNAGIEVAQYAIGPGLLAFQTWSNLWLANNTLYTTNASQTGVGITWSKREVAASLAFQNIVLTNSGFVNNLFFVRNASVDIGTGGGIGWQDWKTGSPWGTTVTYVNEAVNLCDFNTLAVQGGSGAGQKKITYFGVNHNDGETMALTSIYTRNKSTVPTFVNEGTDFALSALDTAARDNGTNFAHLFTHDIMNRTRGAAWSRGAFEPAETNLVRFYSFDGDSNDGPALDSSGLGIDAPRFVLINNSWPTNRAASTLAGSTLRPNVTGNALDFKWNTNNNATIGSYTPTYFDDGNFIAITNLTRLTNLTQFTLSFWARYASGSRLTKIPAGYENDANATLVSAGTATGTVGSWDAQRFNQSIWLNNTRFMIVTNSNASTPQSGNESDRAFGKAGRFVINFPDRGFDNNGDTTNWHHYAITFDSGIVTSYFDGQPWTTNDISGVTNRLTVGRGAGRPEDWIGLGVNTHVGTPAFDNESGTDYPNHGWFNGALDNVRFYDRELSGAEIITDANADGAEFVASGGGDEGGGNAQAQATIAPGASRAQRVRGGRW